MCSVISNLISANDMVFDCCPNNQQLTHPSICGGFSSSSTWNIDISRKKIMRGRAVATIKLIRKWIYIVMSAFEIDLRPFYFFFYITLLCFSRPFFCIALVFNGSKYCGMNLKSPKCTFHSIPPCINNSSFIHEFFYFNGYVFEFVYAA